MTNSNHGRWEGFGMNIYVWALKFSSLQPTLKSIALSYYVEWGGARKVFFSWISDRESLSQALCENWGLLELGMLFLHIWWKDTVLVFVLSACSPLFSTNHSYQSHPLCTLQSLLWEKMLLFSLDHQDALFSVLLRRKTSLF